MKRRALIAAALVTLVAASLAASAGADTQAGARSEAAAVSCNGTINIGNLTVLTGPAAFLGQSQQSWAELAAKRVGAQLGLKARIIGYDTTLDPAVALTAAQRLVGNRSVLATIGPATSGGVASASKTLADASVVHVSPSATAATLTKGRSPTATRFFYRVVADDSVQGTGQAKYAIEQAQRRQGDGLRRTGAVLGRSRRTPSRRTSRRRNVTVQRLSVTNNDDRLLELRDADRRATRTSCSPRSRSRRMRTRSPSCSRSRASVRSCSAVTAPLIRRSRCRARTCLELRSGPHSVAGKQAIVDAWRRDNPGRTPDCSDLRPTAQCRRSCTRPSGPARASRAIQRINIKRKMKAGRDPELDPRRRRSGSRRRRTIR